MFHDLVASMNEEPNIYSSNSSIYSETTLVRFASTTAFIQVKRHFSGGDCRLRIGFISTSQSSLIFRPLFDGVLASTTQRLAND